MPWLSEIIDRLNPDMQAPSWRALLAAVPVGGAAGVLLLLPLLARRLPIDVEATAPVPQPLAVIITLALIATRSMPVVLALITVWVVGLRWHPRVLRALLIRHSPRQLAIGLFAAMLVRVRVLLAIVLASLPLLTMWHTLELVSFSRAYVRYTIPAAPGLIGMMGLLAAREIGLLGLSLLAVAAALVSVLRARRLLELVLIPAILPLLLDGWAWGLLILRARLIEVGGVLQPLVGLSIEGAVAGWLGLVLLPYLLLAGLLFRLQRQTAARSPGSAWARVFDNPILTFHWDKPSAGLQRRTRVVIPLVGSVALLLVLANMLVSAPHPWITSRAVLGAAQLGAVLLPPFAGMLAAAVTARHRAEPGQSLLLLTRRYSTRIDLWQHLLGTFKRLRPVLLAFLALVPAGVIASMLVEGSWVIVAAQSAETCLGNYCCPAGQVCRATLYFLLQADALLVGSVMLVVGVLGGAALAMVLGAGLQRWWVSLPFASGGAILGGLIMVALLALSWGHLFGTPEAAANWWVSDHRFIYLVAPLPWLLAAWFAGLFERQVLQ